MSNVMTAIQLARVAKEANGDCFFETKPVYVRTGDGLHAVLEFTWDGALDGFVIATEPAEVRPLPPEPGLLAVVLDRDGIAWQREAGTGSPHWHSLDGEWTWADLNRVRGPLTLLGAPSRRSAEETTEAGAKAVDQ